MNLKRHSAVSGSVSARRWTTGCAAVALSMGSAAAAPAEAAGPPPNAAPVAAVAEPFATPAKGDEPGEVKTPSSTGETPSPAAPDARSPAAHFSVVYKADIQGVASGGAKQGARYVDNLGVSADLDLDRLVGLQGATVRVVAMNNLGGLASDLTGAQLGVNNDEATDHRLRLTQAWVQESLASGKVSALAGFYDLVSEFEVADSAGLLMSPTFGTSAEFAASGPAGLPSFAETAFAVRLRVQPKETQYLQLALSNARASVFGDRAGPSFTFSDGVLFVAEAGYTGWGKIAAGVWSYSKRQPGVRTLQDGGAVQARVSRGIYALMEYALNAPMDDLRKVTLFAKLGLSDGRTTAFRGSWQAGVLVDHLFASRPESQLSMGVSEGRLSNGFRANARDQGLAGGASETVFEFTYSDRIAPHLSLQPDLQWIHNPSGDHGLKDALVLGLRTTIGF